MNYSDSSSSSDESINENLENIDLQESCDVFRIFLTTDNHLGFMEKDPERGPDSFVCFEECLEIASQEQVDFILLGGDLFHENKPSRDCLTKCQKMFREYCFGDKPIEFEIISDESTNFGHTGFPRANFNDPNLNVAIPVFSIHGNHDDPTGQQNLCVMDTLAAAGLVNYFGKANTNCDQIIKIHPVLLEKGQTKLAIYGLGAIKDERLHNMFEKGAVEFVRPSDYQEEWFNIMVIHQNRSMHGKKNYIPETFLPDFFDLVIWGHEHECLIRPQYNDLTKFYITQPGSSCITSLSESELAPKHCGILKVYKRNFKLDAIPIRSSRPFVMESVVLSECNLRETDKNIEAKIELVLMKKIDRMIEECNKNRKYCYEKQPNKPLVRLKVDYTNFEPINENRFAQKMLNKVANPRNIFQFYKKAAPKSEETNLDPEAAKVLRMHGGGEKLEYLKVQDIVCKYFKKADEKSKLSILTEKGIGDAIQEYIEKDEKDAISELINYQVDKIQKYLKTQVKWQNEFQLLDEIKYFQQMRLSNQADEDDELKEVFEKNRKNTQSQAQSQQRRRAEYQDQDQVENEDEEAMMDEDDWPQASATASKRGRGRAGATSSGSTRGTATRGRGRGRGRGAAAPGVATSASTAVTKQGTQQSFFDRKKLNQKDSDNEIIDLDDEDIPRSNLFSSSAFHKQSAKPLAATGQSSLSRTVGTNSKKHKIDYMDDDDDDDEINELLENKFPNSKKSRTNNTTQNDFEEESQFSSNNTYSIFKKVVKKKL